MNVPQDMKANPNKLVVIAFLVLLCMACGARSPETALEEFYFYKGAEDQLMDPLILAGRKVVPLVIEKIKDRNMPRRRYAIGFLGNGSYEAALPVLQEILQDNTEDAHFRGDALQAVYEIDKQLGANYAKKYESQEDYFGRAARDMLKTNSSLRESRSYWDAWVGRHD
jgi:hypothetical protein